MGQPVHGPCRLPSSLVIAIADVLVDPPNTDSMILDLYRPATAAYGSGGWIA